VGASGVERLIHVVEPLHRGDVRAAQHELDLRAGRRVIPKPLKNAGRARRRSFEVRILVQDHGEGLGAGPSHHVGEQRVPGLETRGGAERGVIEALRADARQGPELLGLAPTRGLLVYTLHPLHTGREQEALADPPRAQNEDELGRPLDPICPKRAHSDCRPRSRGGGGRDIA